MLEWVIGLGIIAFIYSYLYAKTPEKNIPLRIFFLMLSLWTITLLSYTVFKSPVTIITYKYDSSGNFTGKEVINYTIPEGLRDSLSTYIEVSVWVPIVVFVIVLLAFLWNVVIAPLVKEMRSRI